MTPAHSLRLSEANIGNSVSAPANVISGSSFDLSQWLNVSWFFPPDFGLASIESTEHSLIALGRDVVYKFRKVVPGGSTLDSGLRWRLCCEELRDHEQLSPGFYLGLRALNWIDDEPHWTSEEILTDVDPYFPHAADDFAIVTYRIPEDAFFDRIVATHRSIPDRLIRLLAKTLSRFYQQQREGAHIRYVNEADEFLGRRRKNWESIRAIIESRDSVISPTFRVAIQELLTLTHRFMANNERLFNDRGENGYIIGCHGDLTARHIWVRETASSYGRLGFFGRPPRTSQTRRDDLLSDLGSLVLDLETSRYTQVAECLEQHYAQVAPEHFNEELLHFYIAATALRKTARILGNTGKHEAGPAEVTKIEDILSSAYRYTLGLRHRIVVGLAGQQSGEKSALASSLSTLLRGANETRLDTAFEKLAQGQDVVVTNDFDLRSDRLELIDTAAKHRAEYLLVRCNSNLTSTPRVAKQRAQSSVAWDRQLAGAELRYLEIEPTIAPEYLAVDLLRDLSRFHRKSVV